MRCRIDMARLSRAAVFGGMVNGPIGHYWFNALDCVRRIRIFVFTLKSLTDNFAKKPCASRCRRHKMCFGSTDYGSYWNSFIPGVYETHARKASGKLNGNEWLIIL